jgi:hypothetical protein
VALATVLTLLVSVNLISPAANAAPGACADIGLTITYSTPGGPVAIHDDAAAKFAVPVGVPLTFAVTVKNSALIGKPITFNSPNQYLQLAPATISDSGVPSSNQVHALPNVNVKVTWGAGNDGQVSFQATIHPSSIPAGTPTGQLLTLSAQVQGGRCSAKIEIYGVTPAPTPTPTRTPLADTSTPVPTATWTPTATPTATPTNTPTPAVCQGGGLTKTTIGIALAGTTDFYAPADLNGPGKNPPDSRVTVQQPGGNVLVAVQQGEQVASLIDVWGINAAQHPKLVVSDFYQKSYQKVVRVVSSDGSVATLTTGSGFPNPGAVVGFTAHVNTSLGEVYIYNVPKATTTTYQDLYLITEITAARGYITNSAKVRGKVVGNVIVTIPGTCNDVAETAIVNGYTGTIGDPAPIDLP